MKQLKAALFLIMISLIFNQKDIHGQDYWLPIDHFDSCRIKNVKINTSGDIFLGVIKDYSLPDYGGVYRSDDHGVTWTPVCPVDYGSGHGLIIDQFDNIFAGAMDSIFKSETNGDSWENLGKVGSCSVLENGFDSIFFKGGADHTAIVRSGDYGATWEVVKTFADGSWSWVTGFAFAGDGMIYASVSIANGPESGIYKSADLGKTWEPFGMVNYAVMSIAMDNNGNLLAGTLGHGLFRYDMSTQQWTNLVSNTSINGIVVTPDNKFYLASSDMPNFNNLGGCIIYNDSNGTWYNQNSGLMDHFNSDGITIDEEGYLLLWAGGLLFKSSEQVITGTDDKQKLENQSQLVCFPNPAKDYITVEYNLSDLYIEPQKIVIIVNSADGKPVDTKITVNLQDQYILETSNYKPRVYILTLKVNNKLIDTSKFTISQ